MSQQDSTQQPRAQASAVTDTTTPTTQPANDTERQQYYDELLKIVPTLNRDSDYPFKSIKLNRENVEELITMHAQWAGSVCWTSEQHRTLKGLNLCGANLQSVDLQKLSLEEANLSGTNLRESHLEGASLSRAYVGAEASLPPADFQGAFFDNTTNLAGIILSNEHEIEKDKRKVGPKVADAHWDDVNLSVVDWSAMVKLGDEYKAQRNEQKAEKEHQKTQFNTYQSWYQTALRATRQLAVALQKQGISDSASRYGYRAQTIQRHILLLQLLHHLTKHPMLSWLVSKHTRPSDYRQMRRTLILLLTPSIIFTLLAFSPVNMEIAFRIFVSISSILLLSSSLILITFYLLYYSLIIRVLLFISIPISFLYLILMFLIFKLLTLTLSYPEILFVPFVVSMIILESILSAKSGFWEWENVKKRTRRLYLLLLPDIQAAYGRYIFSLFLDMLAGYGYKPARSIAAYLLIIVTFASLYFYIGQGIHPQITSLGAFVLSITSFHGRGFFPGIDPNGSPLPLDNPMIVLAAAEAVVGLIIEISFIATFTQRFFAK